MKTTHYFSSSRSLTSNSVLIASGNKLKLTKFNNIMKCSPIVVKWERELSNKRQKYDCLKVVL